MTDTIETILARLTISAAGISFTPEDRKVAERIPSIITHENGNTTASYPLKKMAMEILSGHPAPGAVEAALWTNNYGGPVVAYRHGIPKSKIDPEVVDLLKKIPAAAKKMAIPLMETNKRELEEVKKKVLDFFKNPKNRASSKAYQNELEFYEKHAVPSSESPEQRVEGAIAKIASSPNAIYLGSYSSGGYEFYRKMGKDALSPADFEKYAELSEATADIAFALKK
jgi:hypothetical protein